MSSRKTAILAESDSRFEGFDERVGARIGSLRRVRGMTQQGLAHHLGVRHQQIQKYEAGVNRFPVVMIMRIAELFSMSVDELLQGTVPGYTSPEESAAPLSVTVADGVSEGGHKRIILEIVNTLRRIRDRDVLIRIHALIRSVLRLLPDQSDAEDTAT